MNPFARYVAPSGTPIGLPELARWAAVAARPDARGRLADALRSKWGPGHYFLSCTGRAGMTLLLRAMRRLRPASRDEVVMPSYTCYSVPASAVKAGLRVRLVDIDPATLDYDRDQLEHTDFRRVLAVVATNPYGLPSDLPRWSKLTRDRGVFLVDDAAQAMGASIGGRLSGTWGDAGLFSFDKGKNVSAIDGGVVVTASDDLADALRAEWKGLREPTAMTTAQYSAKVLVYAMLLRPRLYGLPARMPWLGLGRTIYSTDFATALPPGVLSALAAVMLTRLDALTLLRAANARSLIERLTALPGIRIAEPHHDAQPVYLRLPVLVEAPLRRGEVIAALNAAGIGATGSYPASLADVPQLQPALVSSPAAREGRRVAGRIVTLPTQPFLAAADIDRVGRVLAVAAAGARSSAPAAAAAARLG